MTRIKGTLHKDQYKFLIISRSVRLRMKKCFRKKIVDKIETFYVQKKVYF